MVLGYLSGRGLIPATGIYDLGPEGTPFANPAIVELSYAPERLLALGLRPEDLRIIQIKRDATLFEEFPGAFLDRENRTGSATVSRFSSLFALFVTTTPVAARGTSELGGSVSTNKSTPSPEVPAEAAFFDEDRTGPPLIWGAECRRIRGYLGFLI